MRNSVPKRRPLRWLARLLVVCAASSQAGCYYLQAAQGQLALSRARQPIETIVADPATPDTLRQRLQLVDEARAFAHTALGLPDNGSYRSFVDLQRDYVVVNVFAAPALSLQAKRWCYPFVGCLAYRGYFDAADASRYAARLAQRGLDVTIRNVPAYSTLGRFEDPVLSTMLARDDAGLVSLLFHELAHQLFYVDGDTAFNESFASFVASEGLRRWNAARAIEAPASDNAAVTLMNQRREALIAAMASARERLQEIYAGPAGEQEKLEQKARVFVWLERAWRANGATSRPPSNNADFLPSSLYSDLTPAFAALLESCDQALACFYSRARALGELDESARESALVRLARD